MKNRFRILFYCFLLMGFLTWPMQSTFAQVRSLTLPASNIDIWVLLDLPRQPLSHEAASITKQELQAAVNDEFSAYMQAAMNTLLSNVLLSGDLVNVNISIVGLPGPTTIVPYTNFLEDIPETTRQNFPQVSSQTLLADGMFEIHKRMRKIQENSDQANITAYQLIDPKPSYTFIISPKRYLFKNDQYIQPAKSQEGLIGKTMASYPNATVIAIELCDQDCAFDANDKHSIMKEIASPVPNAPHKKQYIKIKPLELAKFFKNNVHFQN